MAKSSKFTLRSESQDVSKDSTECRVCVNNAGVLPIFGDSNRPDISLEITMFGGIQLHANDGLPKYICEVCFKLLEAAIEFRNSAKRSDALLKRRKKKRIQSNVKSELFKVEDVKNKFSEPLDKVYKLDIEFEEPVDTSFIKDETVREVIIDDIDYNDHNYGDNNKETAASDVGSTVMLIVSGNKKKPKKGVIFCRHCNLVFESKKELEDHKESLEHKRNYVTSFLPKKQKEEKKTVNPKDRKCDICNRLFTKLHYPRHMQTKHKIKMETSRSINKKECTICNRMFHPVALIRHMKKAHSEEKDLPPKPKLECPVCKKMFSKDFYPLHMQRHKEGDTKNYICDQCGKKFFYKSTFYTHRLIHTNELPHKCNYCPYRGRTKGLLKIHVRTHTGDYPYKCSQCETRCLTKSNLNAHMQRHRGPIDFICDTCSRGFYSKLDLERHISVIHMGIKDHVCNICGMAFGYRHGLMSHLLKVHKRAKLLGKAKAVYLKLEEAGLLQSEQSDVQS